MSDRCWRRLNIDQLGVRQYAQHIEGWLGGQCIVNLPRARPAQGQRVGRSIDSLQPDGGVQVINRCRQGSGEMKEALGSGRQIGDATSSKLEVRFAPAWLSFLPMVWGDHWVIDLDPAYQLVAVSEPKREYLWILSRSMKVDSAAYDALLGRLTRKGFDLQRLERTLQQE